jgi:succinoglycan biosynthesis transport protein ExoP
MNGTQQVRLNESFGLDLLAIFAHLRKKAWLIIACVLMAGLTGAIYIIYGPKIYCAQAVIQVEQQRQKVLKTDGMEAQDLKSEEIPKTIEQSLTSPELLVGLIVHNDLNKDPAFLRDLKRPASDSELAEELAKQISAQVRRGTLLIDIKVNDRSPLLAQKIVDLLVKEFTRQCFQQNMETSETIHSFLLAQAEQLKAKLAKSEEALQIYREQHQSVALLGDKDNIVVEKLAALNRIVTEAKAARLKLEADYEQIKNLGTGAVTALLAIPSIANSPVVFEAQKNIAQKEAEIAGLHQIYKAGDAVPSAMKQLQELKAGLDRMILKAADELTSAYDSAVATEEKMEKALQEQARAALDLNKVSISYNLMRQEVDSDRALYESVLSRLKETDVTKGDAQDGIRVVSHPLLPERPVSPDKKQILFLSLFGGLALGGGLALLSILLNTSLETVEEAERQLGVPVLGVIPKCAHRPKWLTDDLLLIEKPGSATAESFRSLRTSLSLLGKSEGHKAFLFTSAVVSEGKSFCAVNCAVAFAQMGLKTLLIDADLRKPSIHKIFFNGESVQGLTEILTNRMDLDDTVWLTNISKLSVLCAGTRLDTPSELLAGEGFGQLIKKVTAKFDRVVVDSAPIHAVSDTLLLAGHAHATCLVVSSKTSAEAVSQALRKLGDADSTLVGFIFNRASVQRDSDYGYRYSQAGWAHAKSGKRKGAPKSPLQLERPGLT